MQLICYSRNFCIFLSKIPSHAYALIVRIPAIVSEISFILLSAKVSSRFNIRFWHTLKKYAIMSEVSIKARPVSASYYVHKIHENERASDYTEGACLVVQDLAKLLCYVLGVLCD